MALLVVTVDISSVFTRAVIFTHMQTIYRAFVGITCHWHYHS